MRKRQPPMSSGQDAGEVLWLKLLRLKYGQNQGKQRIRCSNLTSIVIKLYIPSLKQAILKSCSGLFGQLLQDIIQRVVAIIEACRNCREEEAGGEAMPRLKWGRVVPYLMVMVGQNLLQERVYLQFPLNKPSYVESLQTIGPR